MGGIGGVVAGCLRAADRVDVVGCGKVALDHLVLERPEGTVDVALRTLADPAQAHVVDWVLLATKAHQTASTAPWLARLCGSTTRVATLQNGIAHAERVGPHAGPARVVPAIVYYNGERLAADRVRLRYAGDYDLAVADDADGRAFAALLEGTPLRVLLAGDLATLFWRKLLLNIVANPITALTLRRQEVLRRNDMRELGLALLREAVVVARADGAQLSDDEPERALATLLTYPPDAGTSMYFDRLAGRSFEVDALTGAVVDAGNRLGVPTPLNRAMLSLLHALEDAPRAG
jgi:2-dehydropantoate 2-reductase